MASANRGPHRHEIDLPKLGKVNVYAGKRVGDALEEVQEDLTLYKGVRLAQVLEAVYEQGLQDGRRQVFDATDEVVSNLSDLKKRKDLTHRNPGRPRKAAKPD